MTSKVFNPDTIKIVGFDTERTESHPLQNPSPPFPSEGLIESVKEFSQLTDVVLIEEGGEVLVAIGRKRVLAAREANKRLDAENANYRHVITGRITT